MINQQKLNAAFSWLIAGAQPAKSVDEIVEECALRLIEVGVPIDVLILNGLFIHPHTRGIQILWSKNRGRSRETFTHQFMDSNAFQDIETAKCIQTGRMARYPLDPATAPTGSEYLRGFEAAGYSEVFFMPLFNFDGSVTGAIEVGTRQPGGFDEDHILALRRMQAPLARLKENFTENYEKQITLATYVGEKTSRKVLNGNIILGGGETISAVLLFADLVGFTQLSNSSDSARVLKTLNTFFAAIDTAVGLNNGEILKFLGDGVLVIFQTPDDLSAQEAAASSAIEAVALVRKILAEDEACPDVEFRAALHIGDVFFGNIGSGNRLDFTAIGPAVNLASRMLDEASARDAKTVCSEGFRRVAIGLEAEPVESDLKGFDQTETIFVVE
jgi:adenylate cyclase